MNGSVWEGWWTVFSVGKYQEKMKKILILIDIIVICGMIDIEKVLPIDG